MVHKAAKNLDSTSLALVAATVGFEPGEKQLIVRIQYAGWNLPHSILWQPSQAH